MSDTTASIRRQLAALPPPELAFVERLSASAVAAQERMFELRDSGAAGAEVAEACTDYLVSTIAHHHVARWLERFTP